MRTVLGLLARMRSRPVVSVPAFGFTVIGSGREAADGALRSLDGLQFAQYLERLTQQGRLQRYQSLSAPLLNQIQQRSLRILENRESGALEPVRALQLARDQLRLSVEGADDANPKTLARLSARALALLRDPAVAANKLTPELTCDLFSLVCSTNRVREQDFRRYLATAEATNIQERLTDAQAISLFVELARKNVASAVFAERIRRIFAEDRSVATLSDASFVVLLWSALIAPDKQAALAEQSRGAQHLQRLLAVSERRRERARAQQVLCAQIYLRLRALRLASVPEPVLEALARNFREMRIQPIRSGALSVIQEDIQICLNVLKIAYKEEQEVEFYRVDFLLENRLVIEVNGPVHYAFAEDSAHLNGKTKMKLDNLECLGYAVRTVHHAQWSKLKGVSAKLTFLSDLIYNHK